jgi:hypothetical protein
MKPLVKHVLVALLIAVSVFAMCMPIAVAQEAPAWSDIACSQSKLVAPAGLKCRSTQVYSGSSSGGMAQRRNWASFGIASDNKIFLYVVEEVSTKASFEPGALEHSIRRVSPEARNGRAFSAQKELNGGNYETFTSAAGGNCIAIRKLGTARKRGFEWVVEGTTCALRGRHWPVHLASGLSSLAGSLSLDIASAG